ncbi:MAG: hypothetical protein ACYS4W_14025 [Planctomycetota bacterium]|jgi:hypothetical protein
MNEKKGEKWLDELICRAVGSGEPQFDPASWQEKFPEEFEILKSRAAQDSALRPNVWRIIMKSSITKLAAAAVIIIVAVVAIHQFGGSIDGTTVAWAKLAERVEQIETVSYRMHTTCTTEEGQGESLVYQSCEYGQRLDTFSGDKLCAQAYSLARENVFVVIMHQSKKYMRKELTEEQAQQFPKVADPRKWLKKLLSEEYRKLGRDIIDGVEVEGIEVEGPHFMGGGLRDCRVALWVEVEDELPVRLISESMPSEGRRHFKTVFDNFEWNVDFESSVFENVDFESSVFEPVIPPDYSQFEWPMPPGNRDERDD